MNNTSKSFIVTDYKILRQIQRIKYRRLLLPICLIFLAVVISYVMRGRDHLYYPLLVLTVAGVTWYGYVMMCFRTKNRIAEVEPDMMVIPLEGKIRSLRSNEEMHSIRITKAFIDVIGIRAPITGEITREGDNLIIKAGQDQIHMLFHGNNIIWFDLDEPIAGRVIGLLIGKGSCTINIPASYQLQVVEGQIVFGGETVLCPFKPAVS